MRLNEILQDEPYMPINYKKLITENFKSKKFIFRGINRNNTKYFVTDGSKMNRVSEGASFFNSLTEVLPSWKGWPPRTKSFSCSNNYLVAAGYADNEKNVHMVIPLENQPIAVSSKSDFWDANEHLNKILFEEGTGVGFSSSNFVFIHFLNEAKIKYSNQFNGHQCLENLIELFDYFKEVTSSSPSYSARSMFLSKVKNLNSPQELVNLVNEALDPVKNGNTVYPSYNTADILISRNSYTANEIWMSGKVLFVRIEEYCRLNKTSHGELYKGTY